MESFSISFSLPETSLDTSGHRVGQTVQPCPSSSNKPDDNKFFVTEGKMIGKFNNYLVVQLNDDGLLCRIMRESLWINGRRFTDCYNNKKTFNNFFNEHVRSRPVRAKVHKITNPDLVKSFKINDNEERKIDYVSLYAWIGGEEPEETEVESSRKKIKKERQLNVKGRIIGSDNSRYLAFTFNEEEGEKEEKTCAVLLNHVWYKQDRTLDMYRNTMGVAPFKNWFEKTLMGTVTIKTDCAQLYSRVDKVMEIRINQSAKIVAEYTTCCAWLDDGGDDYSPPPDHVRALSLTIKKPEFAKEKNNGKLKNGGKFETVRGVASRTTGCMTSFEFESKGGKTSIGHVFFNRIWMGGNKVALRDYDEAGGFKKFFENKLAGKNVMADVVETSGSRFFAGCMWLEGHFPPPDDERFDAVKKMWEDKKSLPSKSDRDGNNQDQDPTPEDIGAFEAPTSLDDGLPCFTVQGQVIGRTHYELLFKYNEEKGTSSNSICVLNFKNVWVHGKRTVAELTSRESFSSFFRTLIMSKNIKAEVFNLIPSERNFYKMWSGGEVKVDSSAYCGWIGDQTPPDNLRPSQQFRNSRRSLNVRGQFAGHDREFVYFMFTDQSGSKNMGSATFTNVFLNKRPMSQIVAHKSGEELSEWFSENLMTRKMRSDKVVFQEHRRTTNGFALQIEDSGRRLARPEYRSRCVWLEDDDPPSWTNRTGIWETSIPSTVKGARFLEVQGELLGIFSGTNIVFSFRSGSEFGVVSPNRIWKDGKRMSNEDYVRSGGVERWVCENVRGKKVSAVVIEAVPGNTLWSHFASSLWLEGEDVPSERIDDVIRTRVARGELKKEWKVMAKETEEEEEECQEPETKRRKIGGWQTTSGDRYMSCVFIPVDGLIIGLNNIRCFFTFNLNNDKDNNKEEEDEVGMVSCSNIGYGPSGKRIAFKFVSENEDFPRWFEENLMGRRIRAEVTPVDKYPRKVQLTNGSWAQAKFFAKDGVVRNTNRVYTVSKKTTIGSSPEKLYPFPSPSNIILNDDPSKRLPNNNINNQNNSNPLFVNPLTKSAVRILARAMKCNSASDPMADMVVESRNDLRLAMFLKNVLSSSVERYFKRKGTFGTEILPPPIESTRSHQSQLQSDLEHGTANQDYDNHRRRTVLHHHSIATSSSSRNDILRSEYDEFDRRISLPQRDFLRTGSSRLFQ